MTALVCRSCGAKRSTVFLDLGLMPPSNAFRTIEQLSEPELFFPLRVFICGECKLVQLQDFISRETHFNEEYPYFSSYSSSWLEHVAKFAEGAANRFALNRNSLVVEVASNDGYLLKHFLNRGMRVLGIDPAANCAAAARENHGLETIIAFFGRDLAAKLRKSVGPADLMVANNVLAHVPDPNDFLAGFSILLAQRGYATFEFPHLLELIARNEFDTIYHEHYSYLSLFALIPLFARHGLSVVDVEKLPTHGHSLRLYVRHDSAGDGLSAAAQRLLAEERAAGIDEVETYLSYGEHVKATKRALLALLVQLKGEGRQIVGYGAPAKGNTLLNYCGIRSDFVDFTVDRNPIKQGRFLPGTCIPILAPSEIKRTKPDYVLILPWNIRDEIMQDLKEIRDWGGRFIVPIPEPAVLD